MWETMRTHHRRLPRGRCVMNCNQHNHVDALRRTSSRFLGSWVFLGTTCATKLRNHVFYGHICVLLINTNSMIYICCIKHKGMAETCVLAVRDDELDRKASKLCHWSLPRGRTHVGRLWKVMWSSLEWNRTHGKLAPKFQDWEQQGIAGNQGPQEPL